MIIAKNWSLYYREMYASKTKKLKEDCERLYNENQKMKRRLKKHEGSMRMVYYNNEKDK